MTQPGLKEAYDLYSFNVIPKIGGLVAQDEASYQYLVESIRQFPDQVGRWGMACGVAQGRGMWGGAWTQRLVHGPGGWCIWMAGGACGWDFLGPEQL